jgi:hypothetical protein
MAGLSNKSEVNLTATQTLPPCPLCGGVAPGTFGASFRVLRVNYKETLNLPQIEFPLKANPTSREPGILARWESEKLCKARHRSTVGGDPDYLKRLKVCDRCAELVRKTIGIEVTK